MSKFINVNLIKKYDSKHLIELLGKPESDSAVQDLLIKLGQTKSLKKPKRGEHDVYVEGKETGRL
jgi:hypothetical protein